MLTVHHLGISQSERIPWLCEELGIDYQLVRYERDKATRLAPAEYKALHPIGTAPVITDGDLVLAESGAIMDYIMAKYGNGGLAVAPNAPGFADYLFWFHFANGSLMSSEMAALVANLCGGPPDNPVVRAMQGRLDRAFALIEQRLAAVPFLAGDHFTAADIIMLFPLTTMRAFVPLDLGPYPSIRAYLKRIGERPAYRRAMAASDPTLTPMLD